MCMDIMLTSRGYNNLIYNAHKMCAHCTQQNRVYLNSCNGGKDGPRPPAMSLIRISEQWLQSTRPKMGAQEGAFQAPQQQPSFLLRTGAASGLLPGFLHSQHPLQPGPAWSPCTFGGQRHSQSLLCSRTVCRAGLDSFPMGHSCPGVPRRCQPHGKLRRPSVVHVPTVPGVALSVSHMAVWDPTTLTGRGLALLISLCGPTPPKCPALALMLHDPVCRSGDPSARPQPRGTGSAWGPVAAGAGHALHLTLLQNLHDSVDLKTFSCIT